MVGEEGRAQMTAGYRQATEEANETHPYSFFSPLGVYGLPHIKLKTISDRDASRRYWTLSPLYFGSIGTLLPRRSILSFSSQLGLSCSDA
jgi:hypothetical protein